MVLSFLPFKGMEPRAPEALWGTSQFDSWFLLDVLDHITTDYMTVASLGLRHVVAKQTKHISIQTEFFFLNMLGHIFSSIGAHNRTKSNYIHIKAHILTFTNFGECRHAKPNPQRQRS